MHLLRPLLLCSIVAVGACSSGSSGDDDAQAFGALSLFDPVASDPGTGTVVPFPFNGLFSGFKDPTLAIPNPSAAPFVTAANLTDGFSTTASIFTDLVGFVDYDTAAGAILIFENDASPRFLAPGVDFTVQSSPALAGVSGTSPSLLRPLREHRSRLLIEPLKPLNPSTTYIVAVTTALRSTDGLQAQPAELFQVASAGVPVADQDFSLKPVLSGPQLATLEVLRQQLLRPALLGVLGAYNAGADPDLTEDDIVIAWPFTTQSVHKTMERVNTDAGATTITVVSTGMSTGDLGLGLADTADIYAGTFNDVPYFLGSPSNALGDETNAPTNPLTQFWRADQTAPDLAASFLGAVPCAAFAAGATLPDGQTAEPSFSTTICYPKPRQRSVEDLPILVTVPTTGSKPYPVVIFQHGITRNRADMLAIAPTLASAGFVTVAIDLPLHGIRSIDGATAAFRINGLERTFELDLVDNTTGASGPDTVVDSSGTHFLNLGSLLTSRDNLRQASADLIHLAKSVGALDYDGGGVDVDPTRIHFVGHSLGGVVGTVMLGVNSEVKAATLAMTGGGLGKLLDASVSFGPRIAAGLAVNSVIEGTDTYETFLRFGQHLADPGDSVNFADAAREGHAIHMLEVIGDTTFPNTAFTTCPDLLPPVASTSVTAAAAALLAACPGTASQDETLISGYLSGTEPMAALMGLEVVGPLTVPIAAQAPQAATDLGVLVQFTDGNHGSIIDPSGGATNAAVTCEMQRQTASFLATGGTVLPVGGTCPTPP